MDPVKLFEALIAAIDRYFASPIKEILIGAFCATLILGFFYGTIGGFKRRPTETPVPVEDAPPAPPTPSTVKKLQTELENCRRAMRTFQLNQRVEIVERYYLYFNGIANASLMLAVAILLDRYYQALPPFGAKQAEIGKLLTMVLAGLLISIIFNILFDLLAPRAERRTDLINRGFLISFVANLIIFLAYHFRYVSP